MIKRNFLIFIFVFVFGLIGFGFLTGISMTTPASEKLPEITIQPTLKPRPGIPTLIQIPKLAINSKVESVGLDNEGNMDVPKEYFNVAWYNLGVRPGENGNAVIAGHLDSATSPAIFANLSNLDINDQIIITDDQNKIYTYKVVEKMYYKTNEFPLEYVFGQTSRKRLNLITCSGEYISGHGYNQRLVVYAELI